MALKRNLIANYLGQGWVALMGLAFVPLYIKYLGVESYGLIGLFAVLQAWLGLLDMGMTPTLGREMARFTGGARSNESIRDLLRSIEIIAVGGSVLIASGVALGSRWIATAWLKADALPIEVVVQAFVIMGLVIALRFMEGIYRSAIIGLQRQELFNVIISLTATLRGLGAVGILMWVSPTIEVFFLWQGVVSIITLAILGITTYKSVPRGTRGGRFSLDAMRGVWRFAGGMVLGTLSGLLLSSTDKIFISKYLSLTDVGFYTFAATVVSVLGVFLGPVNQAIFPRFAELMAKGERSTLANMFLNASQLISVFLGTIGIVLIFYSHKIIFVWSGDLYLANNTYYIITLLAIAALIQSPVWMLYQAQIANGQSGIGAKINVINILFAVPAFFYFIPIYGMRGSAYVLIISAVISLFLHVYFTFAQGIMPNFREWALTTIMKPISTAFLVILSTRIVEFENINRAIDSLFIILVFLLTLVASIGAASRVRELLIFELRAALLGIYKKRV